MHQQPYDMRASPGQRTRLNIRHVTKLCHCTEYTLALLRADMRFIVQHTRNGRIRNASFICDIKDGNILGWFTLLLHAPALQAIPVSNCKRATTRGRTTGPYREY